MPWPRRLIAHTDTGSQELLKTVKSLILETQHKASKQRQPFVERSYIAHRRTDNTQGKRRIPINILSREAASKVPLSPLFSCSNGLEGRYEDKHARWCEVQVSKLNLDKMAQETPSARQSLPDGKPLVIYVKKKINSLIDSFPASGNVSFAANKTPVSKSSFFILVSMHCFSIKSALLYPAVHFTNVRDCLYHWQKSSREHKFFFSLLPHNSVESCTTFLCSYCIILRILILFLG